jgi:DUF1680 family protein
MERNVYFLDVSNSPFAKIRLVPMNKVVVRDSFWRPRLETLVDKTLPTQYEFLEKTGRIDNFRVASGKKKGSYQGLWFNDSDVYKWVEASSYALIHRWSNDLYEKLLGVVREIVDAQEDDGYINTYVTINKRERWVNLAWSHELYSGGHMIQAAVAFKRVFERDELLNTARRFADLLTRTFGFEEGKLKTSDGHPEIELALIELYRETRNKNYLDLAKFFIDIRGRGLVAQTTKETIFGLMHSPLHLLDHQPIRVMNDFAGSHAVRTLYFFAGATDLYLETGETELWEALKRLWRKYLKKIYITGGAGSRYDGEAFGEDYELPNERAYSETCASVAGVLWAIRMFLASGEAGYVDILEKILYNSALAGISLDGLRYFYVNPLADYFGNHERQPWFETACCPTNIIRLLSYVPGMIYAVSKNEPRIWVNLFVASDAEIDLPGGKVVLSLDTTYPWSGDVSIRIRSIDVEDFSLMIRVPKWATETKIKIGEEIHEARAGEYFELRRRWGINDLVKISIPMRPRLVSSHPWVESNWGRVAISRGPLIYCLEEIDNKEFDIRDLVIVPSEINLRDRFEPNTLNGVVIVEGEGYILNTSEIEKVAREEIYFINDCYIKDPRKLLGKKVVFRAIPYYAWNNRGRNKMSVWIKTLPYMNI